jgi:hypothetical protein
MCHLLLESLLLTLSQPYAVLASNSEINITGLAKSSLDRETKPGNNGIVYKKEEGAKK